jgi:hypothetical protein
MHDVELQEFLDGLWDALKRACWPNFSYQVYKLSSYLTGNTSSLRYMTGRLMLFKEPVVHCKQYETLMRSVGRMQLSIEAGGTLRTTGL